MIQMQQPDPDSGLGTIVDFPSDSAYALWPIYQSASFKEEMQTAPAGMYWDQTLTFSLAKNSPVVNQLIGELASRTWAVVMRDQNDNFLVAGNRLYPMRLNIKSDTGAEISDLNNVSFTFTASSPIRAVYIGNPV